MSGTPRTDCFAQLENIGVQQWADHARDLEGELNSWRKTAEMFRDLKEQTGHADPVMDVTSRIRALIADDAYAATFQTFEQYRAALLVVIDRARKEAGE